MNKRVNPISINVADWAYRTGYFILRDQKYSLGVLYQALSRQQIVATTQKKREAKRPKRGVRQKVCLSETQILQYLTYVFAEQYERIQESEHQSKVKLLDNEDMIARYLKQLVLIYFEHNSFFAAVGQSSILFDNSTSQTERLYETLVQASPHRLETKGDYSVRDAKREIRQKVAERFESFISTCEGPRKEQRFVLSNNAAQHFRFVKQCLHQFKPLIYVEGQLDSFHLPARFDPIAYDVSELQFEGSDLDPQDEQLVEMRRMHVVTHSCCFARLLRANGCEYSRSRLQLPAFNLVDSESHKDMLRNERFDPPKMTAAELGSVNALLEKQAKRRKWSLITNFSIVVDNVQRQMWNLKDQQTTRIQIPADARIVEVVIHEPDGDIPLALYLPQLERQTDPEDDQPQVIVLEGGQELIFSAKNRASLRDETNDFGANYLEVTISYRETNLLRAAVMRWRLNSKFAWQSFDNWLSPASGYVVASCFAVFLALLVGSLYFFTKQEVDQRSIALGNQPKQSQSQTMPKEPQQDLLSNSNSQSASSVPRESSIFNQKPAIAADANGRTAQTPKTKATRSSRNQQRNSVGEKSAQSSLLTPPSDRLRNRVAAESPKAVGTNNSPAAPLTESPATRSPAAERKGIRLSEVRRIYVDPLEGDQLDQVWQQQLGNEIRKTESLVLNGERQTADAVLVGEITTSNASQRVDLRLTNVVGEVLWSKQVQIKKKSKQTIQKKAQNLIAELLSKIEK